MIILQSYALFVLLVSFSLDTTGATVEHDSLSDEGESDHPSVTKCYPPIPGLDKMQSGIDITKVQLFPTDIDPTNGYRKQIYEFTCNDKVTWTNEFNSQEYILPDQLQNPVVMPVSSTFEFSKLTRGSREYHDSLAVEVGLSGLPPTSKSVTAGGSGNIKNAEGKFFEDSAYVYQMARKSTTYLFALRDTRHMATLSEDFIASVKQLPTNYHDDPSKYENFIEKYGTHFLDQAVMGGRIYQSIDIEQTYINSYSNNDIKVNAEGTYSNSFKTDVKASSSQVSQEFTVNNKTFETLIGGNQSYLELFKSKSNSASLFNDWVQSLSRLPWIVNGHVTPIYNLIDDPNIQTQLELALNVYYVRIKFDVAEMKAEYMRDHGKEIPVTAEHFISEYVTKYETFRDGTINQTTIAMADDDMDDYLDYMDYVEAHNFVIKQYMEYNNFFQKKFFDKYYIRTAWNVIICKLSLSFYCKFLDAFDIKEGFMKVIVKIADRDVNIHQIVEEVRQYQKEHVRPFMERNGFSY